MPPPLDNNVLWLVGRQALARLGVEYSQLGRILVDTELLQFDGNRQFVHLLEVVNATPFRLAFFAIHLQTLHVGRT